MIVAVTMEHDRAFTLSNLHDICIDQIVKSVLGVDLRGGGGVEPIFG